ncbi:hypothetical protein UB45_07730 [Terrabacter sp. 28]|nr:hypothetical protein UB45_07730 [Terrabacter sp. 28]
MTRYTETDVRNAAEALHTNWGTDPKAPPADCEWAARIVLDAITHPVTAPEPRPTLLEEAERLLCYWEQHGDSPEVVSKWALSDLMGILRQIQTDVTA